MRAHCVGPVRGKGDLLVGTLLQQQLTFAVEQKDLVLHERKSGVKREQTQTRGEKQAANKTEKETSTRWERKTRQQSTYTEGAVELLVDDRVGVTVLLAIVAENTILFIDHQAFLVHQFDLRRIVLARVQFGHD
jgi:cobalamin-dependent methionine synthase I